MTLSFDEYLKNNKGALVQHDATKPVNPVDECPPDATGGDVDSQREKVNKDNEKKDASHGDKATVVSEATKEDVVVDPEKDEDDELNESKNEFNSLTKSAYEKNKSKKIGETFEDVGVDADQSGIIVVNKSGTIVVAYEKSQGLELLIIDNTYKYSELVEFTTAGKAALKKLL